MKMPTIASLRSHNIDMFFFYFTNGMSCIVVFLKGNASGKGLEREQELHHLLEYLESPLSHLFILHDPRIQDGMQEKWNTTLCQQYLEEFVLDHSITEIRTFDSRGVSGHPNHISTYSVVCSIRERFNDVSFFTLHSVSLLLKYTGPLSLLQTKQNQDEVVIAANPFLTNTLFHFHKSQITWYRILFSVISQYSYRNVWSWCDPKQSVIIS